VIALTTEKGETLRNFNSRHNAPIGWYPRLGFVADTTVRARNVVRVRGGKPEDASKPLCQFQFENGRPRAISGCKISQVSNDKWQLDATGRTFFIVPANTAPAIMIPDHAGLAPPKSLDRILAVLVLLILCMGGWSALNQKVEEKVTLEDKQKVVIVQNVQVAKPIPPPREKEKHEVPQVQPKKPGAAVQQKLGFLALLGKKELTKAMGGLPTEAERRSPGAGAGGDKGSGGEVLAGLGQGVKHTTVGNSGVAGLGGIGNAGAGGGEGGFGKSYVGSGGIGGGKSLSDVRLGKDIELDGGLDRAVVKATIAKYLSQIQACYERGLRLKPHLAGLVSMDFEIAGSGKLNYARVKTSTLDFPETEKCISQAMLSWQFPQPVGGTLVKVNYPFTLKPSNYM
jgi:hypothetical protein